MFYHLEAVEMLKVFFIALFVVFQLQAIFAAEKSLDDLTEQLFRESEPNLFPYVKVNLQGSTSSWSRSDQADLPLLSIDESAIFRVKTIEKLRALYDNYELDASESEVITPNETNEENEFLNEVLDTQVMQTAMNFLNENGLVHSDRKSHFELLKKIWFGMYPRTRGNIGSSGFEHVFLNEMKYGSPIGLHNWIYFYYKENRTGRVHDLDYNGYMDTLTLGDKGQIVKYRMSFDNVTKPVNSMFIGTLPEFDMALYTVCFEMDMRNCQVSLNGNKFSIRAFPFYFDGKRLVGATYPVI